MTLKLAGMPTQKHREIPALKKDANDAYVLPAVNPKPVDENGAIRAEVVLVTVPVTISDLNGQRISDLTYSDFRLFEDGIEQKIDRVISEAEPFNVALMLDTSNSMFRKASEIEASALAFRAAARTADRIMTVTFSDHIDVESDLWKIHGTGTRLYDAIDLVLEDRLNLIKGRKAIVLFTDGVDTRSRIATAADTLAAIEESDVLVYAIQYDTSRENSDESQLLLDIPSWIELPEDVRNNSKRYARADKYLLSLCNNSGGGLYVASKGSNLTEAFTRIADQLSHQYTLAYYPSNPKQDGSFHRLRVEVNRPGAKVRSRIGYRAPGPLSTNR